MPTYSGRALHFVFKIGDRKSTIDFYKKILGMKILRHEEFSEGCEATCNGPYANRWSKTMIGYGPENDHFVIELTYNYPVKSYEMGNDFVGITIKDKKILHNAKEQNWPILTGNKLKSPGGYTFIILDEEPQPGKDPIEKVALTCSNIQKTIEYWHGLLQLNIYHQDNESVLLGFDDQQAKLEFHQILSPVDRAKAYGRIAFSIPRNQQPELDKAIRAANGTILTPLTDLETPGKATVRVLILSDPDKHEICFVDDEGFRQLSHFDSNGDKLADRYVAKDTS